MAYPTDQLVIDTPEQIALELPLAGIGSRSLAIVVDTLLQVLLYGLLGLLAVGLAAVTGRRASAAAVGALGAFAPAVLLLLAFCVYWGYFALFEALWKGQTPGKRIAGIRVIKDSGRPIDAFEAIGRNLMRAVDGLPGMYAVGIVSMFVSPQNRRLGDYVAGTVVVHDHDAEVRPYLEKRRVAADPLPGAATITADELVLIETYLQRRYDYGFEARTRAAETIAERIRTKLNLPRESVGNPDTFLETVAGQTRDAARFRQ
jgi:uncharacterized RDD family membrane protein YckC